MIRIRYSRECQRCQLFNGIQEYDSPVCGIYPLGPKELPCPDFAEVEEDCASEGTAIKDGELIRDSYYSPVTLGGKKLRDTHLLVTRKCLNCGAKFLETPSKHWQCRTCGRIDGQVV